MAKTIGVQLISVNDKAVIGVVGKLPFSDVEENLLLLKAACVNRESCGQ